MRESSIIEKTQSWKYASYAGCRQWRWKLAYVRRCLSFPYGYKIVYSLTHAKDELIKYGDTFLKGDMAFFIETRKEQNPSREPYRISYVEENGNRQITYEEESTEKKKKYS